MIRLLALELVFLVALLLGLPLVLITDYPGPSHQPNSSRLYSFTASEPFLFSLLNPNSLPLNSLSLTLKNPLIANRSEINLSLILPDGSVHQSLSFSGANVGDPSTVNLSFNPTTSPLTVSLSTSNTLPETLFVIASESLIPVYSTTFRPTSLTERFSITAASLTNRLGQIKPIYLVSYLVVILSISYVTTRRR